MQPNFEIDEKILWEGRPLKAAFINKNWRFILFGLICLAVSVFWEYMALNHIDKFPNEYNIILPIIGLIFILGSIYLLFFHYSIMSRYWQNAKYFVTDKYIYLYDGFKSATLKKIDYEQIEFIEIEKKKGGYTNDVGTIHIVLPKTVVSTWGIGKRMFKKRIGMIDAPRIKTVEHSKNVFDIINDQLKKYRLAHVKRQL